jgi:putative transposase
LLIERHRMSERRACRLLGLDRSSCRYRPRPKLDEELCARLRELAAQHPRYGYRRLGALLEREGRSVNHKKVERLYRQQGLLSKAAGASGSRQALALRRRPWSERINSGRWTSSPTRPLRGACCGC